MNARRLVNGHLGFVCALLLMSAPSYADESHVVVSIKPLHSLVAAVMEGDGEPTLLVDGASSPHSFNLRPSQIEALQHADIVFYDDDYFEFFLRRVLQHLPPQTQRVALAESPGIRTYKLRMRGLWNQPSGDNPFSEMPDLHLWLDPQNAIAMAHNIETVLSDRYPDKRALYQANAARLIVQLQVLNAELHQRMAPLQSTPFIVFHDAYQYFEKAYHLNALGCITFSPELMLSPRHVIEVKHLIAAQQVHCVFSEPSMDPRMVQTLAGDETIRSATLDPEATLLAPGKGLYFTLMHQMADGFVQCLQPVIKP